MFLEQKNILKNINTISEIGGGFGRLCHPILKNFLNIEVYVIIDLPACLALSQIYLKSVLKPKEFRKIVFIEADVDQVDVQESCNNSLFINIDSIAEMDVDVAENYLKLIDEKGSYFYSRNPIGKYHPSSVGIQKFDEAKLLEVFSLGLCREVIDIFNNEDLKRAREKYLIAYKPSEYWEILHSDVSFPWQYYHHVLYKA
jgi:hypothetical protein